MDEQYLVVGFLVAPARHSFSMKDEQRGGAVPCCRMASRYPTPVVGRPHKHMVSEMEQRKMF